jgi:CRISPR/Cas system CSM-associated protein Csm2 small subunit
MLESFFLKYANNSFIEDIENLHKIFTEIISSIDRIEFPINIKEFLFNNIIAFAKDNDPEIAKPKISAFT